MAHGEKGQTEGRRLIISFASGKDIFGSLPRPPAIIIQR